MATDQQTPPTPSNLPPQGRRPAPAHVPAPPKMRRRPMLIALGIALIAVGGLIAAYLTTAVGNTTPVLAIASDIERGHVITDKDLVVADINADPNLNTVDEDQRDTILGKRAATDLPAGSLVTDKSVTDTIYPDEGMSVVGLILTPAQRPAKALKTGDTVRIVDTPRTGDTPPKNAPDVLEATVVEVTAPGDQGQVVVDVTLEQALAADLAARAATGRIALILDAGDQ